MKTIPSRALLLLSGGLVMVALIFLASMPGPGDSGSVPPDPGTVAPPVVGGKANRDLAGTPGAVVGMQIAPGDDAAAERWAAALSRNEHEHAQRLADLKHLKRAEVIRFGAIAENAGKLSTDRLPLRMSLPSFDGTSMEVEFDHLSIDGPEGGTLAGRVLGQPETFVVLGFHNGETSGIVEGPGKMIFLDAFDGEVAILRELDAAAHAADFRCDCPRHRAAAARQMPD